MRSCARLAYEASHKAADAWAAADPTAATRCSEAKTTFSLARTALIRAYATQFEVLRRLRNGGQQVVRVEHVHVNDSGQAFMVM
jgi:hypothetical protein